MMLIQARSFIFCSAFSLVLMLHTSCVTLPIYTHANRLNGHNPKSVKFNVKNSLVTNDKEQNKIFVGVAISGGGSRAANFGSAALESLDHLGILKYVTHISSVSGGSLPTAYYGLYQPKSQLEWKQFRDKMATDFFRAWVYRMLYPHNIFLTVTSHFDHSTLMAEVFDASYFRITV